MSELGFLAFQPDHFGTGIGRFVVCAPNGEPREVELSTLGEARGHIVTHDAAQLIEEARRQGVDVPMLIDLPAALKLASGLSRDQGGETQWDVWRAVKPFATAPDAWEEFRALSEGRKQPKNDEDALAILVSSAAAIAAFWQALISRLTDEGEISRFWQVEVPAQQIFYQRQLRGISIDKLALDKTIQEVISKKYNSYIAVANIIKQSPSNLGFRDIGPFLAGTDAAFLSEYADAPNLEDYFRIAQDTSQFARAFLDLVRCGRDLSSLNHIAVSGDRVFPNFATMGTVTGRVLVSHPYLQELRRAHRRMLVADDGKRLAYLDYGQFEPAILAVMSEEDRLTSLYNETDLYEALAKSLFGDEALRPTAKRMFLAFCYGMSQENIVRLAVNASNTDDTDTAARAEEFFSQFPSLTKFRDELHNQLHKFGRIQTLLGNHRRRSTGGELTSKERRWAISHAVQGSASLIFKEALIDLNNTFGSNSILLPMHDAVLMQLPDDDNFSNACSEAAAMMKAAVARRCPQLRPKVTLSNFAE